MFPEKFFFGIMGDLAAASPGRNMILARIVDAQINAA